MKLFLLLAAVVVLAAPAAAPAKKPPKPPKPPKTETYVLHGTLSAYTAAGAAAGSITILVAKANKAGRAFVGQSVTFIVPATTKVEPAATASADGDLGMIQVKGPSGMTDPLVLGAVAPKQIEDETLLGDHVD
jgi:hypothetical protein